MLNMSALLTSKYTIYILNNFKEKKNEKKENSIQSISTILGNFAKGF